MRNEKKLTFDKAIEIFKYNMETFETPVNTVRNRLSAVNMFVNFCMNTGLEYIDQVDYETAIKYTNYLKQERRKSGSTINCNLAHVRALFKLLYKTKHVSENKAEFFKLFNNKIAAKIKGERQREYKNKDGKIKLFITREDREKILEAASQTTYSERNALMLEMCYVCAMRISEVVEIKAGNINFEKCTIFIYNTKRNKSRTFICGNLDFLRRLKAYIEASFLEENEYVFQNLHKSAKKTCLTTDAFDDIFRQILRKAGLPVGRKEGGYCTHDMRGTGITILLESGVPLVVVRDLVGHEDVEQTMLYYRRSDTDAKLQMLKNAARKGSAL